MATNAYRAAYEEADAELLQISKEVEQLRSRQNQIGKLVDALKSVALDAPSAAEPQNREWATR